MKLHHLAAIVPLVLLGCATPSDPEKNDALFSIELVSRTTTPGWAMAVWVEGNRAYVADDEQGVTVWDVSNLGSPQLVDTIITDGKVFNVGILPRTNLFVTQERTPAGGLTVYDMPTQSRLTTIGSSGSVDFDFKELAADTAVIAEIESDGDGLQIIKFFKDGAFGGAWTDELRGAFRAPRGFFYGFALDAPNVYIAHGEFGVTVLNVDLSTWGAFPITTVGNTDTPGSAREIAQSGSGDKLFVADFQSGLQIVDVSDRTAPRIVGGYLPTGVNEVLKVRAMGDTAVFTDRYNGIFAVDADNPAAPKLVGVYDTPDPQGLFIRQSDGTIFLADQELGLLILKFRN